MRYFLSLLLVCIGFSGCTPPLPAASQAPDRKQSVDRLNDASTIFVSPGSVEGAQKLPDAKVDLSKVAEGWVEIDFSKVLKSSGFSSSLKEYVYEEGSEFEITTINQKFLIEEEHWPQWSARHKKSRETFYFLDSTSFSRDKEVIDIEIYFTRLTLQNQVVNQDTCVFTPAKVRNIRWSHSGRTAADGAVDKHLLEVARFLADGTLKPADYSCTKT
jgi:hypothetical protein